MKNNKRLNPLERLQRMRQAGMAKEKPLRLMIKPASERTQEERQERLHQFIQLMTSNQQLKTGHTLAFILYDIEDNRVRRYVAKYLESKGYLRVQKSVFFGNVKLNLHKEVKEALKKVNASYDNGDSIVILPISQDALSKMGLIGKNLSFEFSMGYKNTLFF
jgi:CRISPR-associated protein Cas2